MQKKQYWNVKTLVFMALLIAMHLVLTRVLVIDLGAYRISVGSVCTILAGLWLGPVAGGVCGLCADIIGCFMKGYAVIRLSQLQQSSGVCFLPLQNHYLQIERKQERQLVSAYLSW